MQPTMDRLAGILVDLAPAGTGAAGNLIGRRQTSRVAPASGERCT
jgi:hypothetical protein